MVERTEKTGEKKLSVTPTKTLTLKGRPVEQAVARQSFKHGRTKAVVVEKVRSSAVTNKSDRTAADDDAHFSTMQSKMSVEDDETPYAFNEAIRRIEFARSVNAETLNLCELGGLTEIPPLTGLSAVEGLSLAWTRIANISAVSELKNLRILSLCGTQVADLRPLVSLISLELLDLWGTNVSDLTPLANLTHLKILNLQKTKIASLASLANLKFLEKMDIRGTAISDLSPLSKLERLTFLRISGTQISNLDPLINLTGLINGANSTPDYGGIVLDDCPLDDPDLLNFRSAPNPERTTGIIIHLRAKHGLSESIDPLRRWDFFLSYAGEDETFARWISKLITAAGFRIFSQFNEILPGRNFVREMLNGLDRSNRVIALLSPDYVKSDHCMAEWSAAYNSDPGGQERKLIPFLIRPSNLPSLAKQIVYKPLVGLSPSDAARAVLESLGYNGVLQSIPRGWPAGAAIEQMRSATGGVFNVVPNAEFRLQREPPAVKQTSGDGFTPDQLFADMAAGIADFYEQTKQGGGNFACSSRLKDRAAKLQEVSLSYTDCDPLALHKQLVWVLRVLALDKADGTLPENDEFDHFASDLYGYYNRLEYMFPRLKQYRQMDARDRFQMPNAEVEEAIHSVYANFGNPQISKEALSANLTDELRNAGEEISELQRLAERETMESITDVAIESHTDAATRSLSVWEWLSNAREKFTQSGGNAEEVRKAVENYEKLYEKVSPQMITYIGYLLKWFF